MINQLKLFEILNYNPETGLFIWLKSIPQIRIKIGDVAGTILNDGYIQIKTNGKKYFAHRLAWLYMTGELPENDIDHINLIKNDNRFCNLRKATKTQNFGNKRKLSNNKSGIKGISWAKKANKWLAQIQINNKRIHLGYFNNIDNAAKAYENAAFKYFGEFARTE